MTIYCIICSFITETDEMVCVDCAYVFNVPTCFVPDLCQDELCYVLPNGEINLDGETCDHAEMFDQLFPLRSWRI